MQPPICPACLENERLSSDSSKKWINDNEVSIKAEEDKKIKEDFENQFNNPEQFCLNSKK